MRTAFDYPVTAPYGYSSSYQGFHTGVDYGASEGVPIVVNGVLIGLVGWTGDVYDNEGEKTPAASHLHVSHIVNGAVSPIKPGDGRTVSGARVSQISEDSKNGKFVRLADADGTNWVYCHMSNNQILKVGDVLANQPQYNGGGEPPMPDKPVSQQVVDQDLLVANFQVGADMNIDQAGINSRIGAGQTALQSIREVGDSKERKEIMRLRQVGLDYEAGKLTGYTKVGNINGQDVYAKS